MQTDLIAVLARIDRALEGLHVAYVIGEPRMTQDVDVLLEIAPWHLTAVAKALGEFSIDSIAAAEALRRGDAFQAIDDATGWKIDLFPAGDEPADLAQLARRVRVDLDPTSGDGAWIASPEDIVLRKLEWFRRSGGVLERQLRDVVGVLKVQRGRLDEPYLTEHARRRGLSDLLDRARRAAGAP